MKRTTKIIAASLATVVGLGAAGFAMAKDDGRGMHGMGGGMNQAAVTACQNQTEGATVVFNHPMWGNVNAVCAKTPDGKIAAMPAKMVAHMKSSQAACNGKNEGDKVSIESIREPGKQIEATCKKHGDVLAAHPAGMKGMHGDHQGMRGDKNMPPM